MPETLSKDSLNPYFTGLSILIGSKTDDLYRLLSCLNPYFTGLSILMRFVDNLDKHHVRVSILILLDYLFLSLTITETV